MTEAQYLALSTLIYSTKFHNYEQDASIQECVNGLKRTLNDNSNTSAAHMNNKDWKDFADTMQALIDADPEFGKYTIGDYTVNDSTGFRVITFISPDKKNVEVIFRGTAEPYGWSDDGKGMYLTSSSGQREAADYIGKIHEQYTNANINVSGHSKGGNLAQYVTIVCPYINKCVSFDGQGFSVDFVKMMKEEYPNYEELCDKITNISAEGDFVNCLGVAIASVVKFVKTPDYGFNLPEYHNPWILLQTLNGDLVLPSSEKNSPKWYAGIINAITVEMSEKGLASAVPMEIAMFVASILTSSDKIEALKNSIIKFNDSMKNEINYYVIRPILEDIEEIKETYHAVKVYAERIFNGVKDKAVEVAMKTVACAVIAYKVVKNGIEKIQEAIKDAIDMVKDIAGQITYLSATVMKKITDKIVDGLKTIGKQVEKIMKKFNEGKQYAATHPMVKVNTEKLRNYANTLRSVNAILVGIDQQMNSLYWKVGFADLWNLLKADLGTSYSLRLRQCISYLEDTATDFEAAEREIQANI